LPDWRTMGHADKIEVTFFKPRSLWKKAIGTHLGEDGRPRTTIFWLGRDHRQAVDHVGLILQAMAEFRADGKMEKHWTPETLIQVRQAMKQNDARLASRLNGARVTIAAVIKSPRPPKAPTPATPERGKTLHQATITYIESLERKNVSEAHKNQARYLMDKLRKIRADVPMKDVDFAWLDELADHFKSRPKMKNGERMKPASVKNFLGYLRTFFVWCDDVAFGGWAAPRKMMKVFRVVMADLMTPTERRHAAKIDQFTLPELRRLYQFAKPKVRAWILAALFTGGTQYELAVMEREEFDLDAGMLMHIRNKTSIAGQFWLPPELVGILQKSWAKKAGTLAFITRDNRPIVNFQDGRKSDATHQAWQKLRKAANRPDALSFKYLRKFAADYALKAGGESMGQIALSHSRNTMMAKCYTSARDFEAFHKIQRQMYADLTAAGLFTPFTVEELQAEAKAREITTIASASKAA
jgi:integrase